MTKTLDVYIDNQCEGCGQARRLVNEMRTLFPAIKIQLRDKTQGWPQEVFAVPTYMLNGRVISLGNPSRQKLVHHLTQTPP